MQDTSTSPLSWLQWSALRMGWPIIVGAAFWLGRYVQKLEMRVDKVENNIRLLIERHMPAIHQALAEIRGLLMGGR